MVQGCAFRLQLFTVALFLPPTKYEFCTDEVNDWNFLFKKLFFPVSDGYRLSSYTSLKVTSILW